MKRALWFLSLLFLTLAYPGVSGCGGKEAAVPYRNITFGIELNIPPGWDLTEEKERDSTLTLQMQNEDQKTSFITVTVIPASLLAQEEVLKEAEKLLKESLYAVDEDTLASQVVTLASGETLPAVSAQAGQKDKVDALCVSRRGSNYQALVTLIARHEYSDLSRTGLQALLDSMKIE